MHLRLAIAGTLREVLPSDVAGEVFHDIAEGTSTFDESLGWLSRAASTLVFVNGELLSDDAQRSTILSDARRLLGQLAESKSLRRPARVAIVLSKADRLGETARKKWEDR